MTTTENTEAFERKVLGGLMIMQEENEPKPPYAALLLPQHFTTQLHGHIFNAIRSLEDASEPVDLCTVTGLLTEWGIKVAEVAEIQGEVGSVANLNHYAKKVVEAGQSREIRRKVANAMERTKSGSIDDIRAGLRDAMDSIETEIETGGLVHISKIVKTVVQEICDEADGKQLGAIVKTGLRAIDEAVRLRAGDMTILAGRPGMGKTALAGNIAQYAARDTRGAVAIFSLEMRDTDLIRRMMVKQARVSDRELVSLAGRGQLAEAANEIYQLDLYVDDTPRLGVDGIRAALRKIRNVKLIIVDYLQLAKMSGNERHDLKVGAVTKGLKALAKERECHVLALSQLNRGVETRGGEKKPQLSDLRDSGNIEEDADNVWLLWRKGYYDDNEDTGETEINFAKHRKGETGKSLIRWTGATQTFSDML